MPPFQKFKDELEMWADRKVLVKIIYKKFDVILEAIGLIQSTFFINKTAFVLLDNDLEISMDTIISITGNFPADYCD